MNLFPPVKENQRLQQLLHLITLHQGKLYNNSFYASIGETKFFNLDGDSSFEISMLIEELAPGKATLLFKAVEEISTPAQQESQTETEKPIPIIKGISFKGKTLKILHGSLIAAIIAIIITIIIITRNYKRARLNSIIRKL